MGKFLLMAQQPKLGTLFGEHGETLSRPPDSLEDLNLPPGVQALVETRANAAIEQLREDNRIEIKNLVHKHTRKWQAIAALLFLFNIASWFIAPQQIKKWAHDYVQERMTQPELKKAADDAIRTKMGSYVQGQIEPLKKEISQKQQQLQNNQEALREQVQIQELATAAKAGDVSSFDRITAKSRQLGPIQSTATAALHEVEMYYDLDAAQLFYTTWGDTVSKQDPGWSVEELLVILQQQSDDASNRMAIVNTIANVGRNLPKEDRGVTEELYKHLESESDLRARARLIRAIGVVTDQHFSPLDIAACKAWWQLHKNEKPFQSTYSGLFKAIEMLSSGKDEKTAIPLLDETIQKNPNAVYARSLKAAILIDAGQRESAQKELAEIEKKKGDYRWMLYWKAKLLMADGKTKEAIDALNVALNRSPSLEQKAVSDETFAPLLNDSNLKLPSKLSPQ
jgi:tetratricopeptide (TPR) repeat protein